jgi:hypothetical protein
MTYRSSIRTDYSTVWQSPGRPRIDVFHCSPPGNQQHSLARWIVRLIVVERGENRQLSQFLFQFPQPPREKTALRFLPRQGERFLIRSTGLRKKLGNIPSVRDYGKARGPFSTDKMHSDDHVPGFPQASLFPGAYFIFTSLLRKPAPVFVKLNPATSLPNQLEM